MRTYTWNSYIFFDYSFIPRPLARYFCRSRLHWECDNFILGDNPHYPSLVPPSIPSTRLVILWDVLLGNSIFSQVLKNLASPSEIQSSLPRLEYLTPCHYLPGRKLIADASPAITQFPQPRPGKIAIATTSPSI